MRVDAINIPDKIINYLNIIQIGEGLKGPVYQFFWEGSVGGAYLNQKESFREVAQERNSPFGKKETFWRITKGTARKLRKAISSPRNRRISYELIYI